MKIRTMLIVCILVLCMMFPAYAAENTTAGESDSPVAAYVLGDKLYAFFEAKEQTQVGLIIGETVNAEKYAEPLAESDQYVHYYILLDASGSVKRAKSQIREVVLELMEQTQVKQLVTVMTLGESFGEVLSASVEDDAVGKALDSISYTEQRTNLYKGIDSAIRFIDEKERTRGDLYRLILITDGEPDRWTEKPSPEEVKRQVEARTDIVFDVIGVGNWSVGSEESLPISGREVNIVSSMEQARDAAAKLADETNNLYTVCFNLTTPVQSGLLDIKLLLKGNEKRLLEQSGITIVSKEVMTSMTGQESAEDESVTEQESAEDASMSEQESGAVDDERETGQSEEAEAESQSVESESMTEQESAEDASMSEQESGTIDDERETGQSEEAELQAAADGNIILQKIMKNLPVYGAVLLCVIVLCVAVILFLRRKPRDDGRIAPNHLRVEVLAGQYASRKKDFSLEHTLLIGSGKQCDIIWNDPDVSVQNTRIFVHADTVCIEDLNSPCGTVIGGMRIFAPNRLRSGDIVCIGGRVQFRVFFNRN